MFGIGSKELILILIIAFVIVGPQDLPKVARALGRAVRWLRGMVEELKRETGMDELEKEFKEEARSLDKTLRQADVRQDLRKTQLELNSALAGIKSDVRSAPGAAPSGTPAAPSRKGPSFAEFKQQRAARNQTAEAEAPQKVQQEIPGEPQAEAGSTAEASSEHS